MRPGTYPMTLSKGATTRLTFSPFNDDDTPWNLTGKTARFRALDPSDAVVLETTPSIVGSVIHFTLTPAQVATLSAAGDSLIYQVDLVEGSDVDRLLVGTIEIGRGA